MDLPSVRLLDTLAAQSQHSNFSVGCYCENEQRCHRSILRRILGKHGARVACGWRITKRADFGPFLSNAVFSVTRKCRKNAANLRGFLQTSGKAPGSTSLFSFPCVTKIDLQDSSSLRRDSR